jgi:hypothetical protein
MGTHLVLIGNIVGTHREPEKNEKKTLLPDPTPNLKGKKSKAT